MKPLQTVPRKALRVIEILLTVYGFFQLLWIFIIKPLFYSSVTVVCPPKIYSHEQVISGTYYPERKDYQVRVYVNPDDKKNKYWLQYQTWQTLPAGEWVDLARFGNSWGVDMAKRPPLDFYVFAVLVKSADMSKLPGLDSGYVKASGHDVFKNTLKQAGVIAISTPFRVERLPEQTCDIPSELSINESPVVTATKKLQVYSPVRCNWEPNRPMFLEVWRGGRKILGETRLNGSELILEPEIYELKIMEKEEFGCFTNVWIEVLPSQQ